MRFLMCPPTYYGIEYEINPWMSHDQPADIELAKKQWEGLYQTLSSLPNVQVELIEPQDGLPDMVFTANAGVIKGNLFISSSFRHPERQGESIYFEKWFAERGYRVEILPRGLLFEGAGDLLKADDTWFGGYYFRSAPQALAAVSEMLKEQVLPLRLIDERFYHLDTCFCRLGDSALYYPGAFDEYSLAVLRHKFPDAVEATEEEAVRFSCNAVVAGNYFVMNRPSQRIRDILDKKGIQCVSVDLSEFIKSGGSAKCLTLALD
jgi:N-dimethylarginine dimethylaminohydrolase